MLGWDDFAQYVEFEVGLVSWARLWHDRWCGDCLLKEVFPELFTCASNYNATIDRCLVLLGEGMAWVWDVSFHHNFNDWRLR